MNILAIVGLILIPIAGIANMAAHTEHERKVDEVKRANKGVE